MRGPNKGRGAVVNPAGRYEALAYGPDEDPEGDGAPPPLCTTVTDEVCRTVISRNCSPDIPFDRSINPYRGCEHGCVYCYARPTHAYLGLSPGLDFETRLFAKANAAEVLAWELARPGYRPRPIMLGANTDPYQPTERRRRITRAVLEVLSAHRHPVTITTKAALVVRDLDLLAEMAESRLTAVGISLTTLDAGLARIMEPRASSPRRRLEAITALAEAGVPVTVMAAPMIPFVNDHELERILGAAARSGAGSAAYTLLRLPLELKEGFAAWLEAHLPERAARVLGRLRDCRGGSLYVSDFGERMRGRGDYADILAKRSALACKRLGLAGGRSLGELDCGQFRVPRPEDPQLRLL
ncbi:MAG: PA0069 family radical SAM protein [Rhodospirillales bacterium]